MGKSGKPGAVSGQCHFFSLTSHFKIPSDTPCVLIRHYREYSHSICPDKASQRILSSIIVSWKATRSSHSPIHIGHPALEEISQLHLEKERKECSKINAHDSSHVPRNLTLPMFFCTNCKADAVGTS